MKIKLTFKSVVSLILCVVMVFAVCPVAFAQQEALACGHSNYNVTIEERKPTCLEYGYTSEKKCNECTYVQKAEYQPATGHDYQMDRNTIDEQGVLIVCRNCGDNYSKKHNNWVYYLLEKKPTCTQDGWTAERICGDCGYHEESVKLAATDHDYDVISSDASSHQVKCKNCSFESGVSSHKTVFVFENGNCYTETAKGHEECTDCGYITSSDITVVKNQHPNSKLVQKNEYKYYVCDDCNYISMITSHKCDSCKRMLDSNDVIRITEPTCTATGYFYYKCNKCSYSKNNSINPIGHHLESEYTDTRLPDCTHEGIKSKNCYRCDFRDDIIIPKISHNIVVLIEGIPATCTEDGLSNSGFCNYCGEMTPQIVLPKTGHNIIDYNGEDFCTNCYKYMIDVEDGSVVECKCLCHNNLSFAQTVFKLILFFCKIIKINQSCDCGAVHYEVE